MKFFSQIESQIHDYDLTQFGSFPIKEQRFIN